MTLGYLAYRCPHCGSERCGNDANAGWDVVTQQSVLLGECRVGAARLRAAPP